jgi:Kef-type K+ transport system membrane component KefB
MDATTQMLLPLAGVLLGAMAAAQISHRFGLPAVFGELLLGLLVGPSVLGWVSPSATLSLLANVGVILLMFMAGLETDMHQMRQVGRASLLTAVGGVLLPLGGGLALGLLLGLAWSHALFLGAVLTATSVSISAQTLRELGRLRSREGSTILGAAVIDDILGVLVFALVMSLAGEGSMWLTIGKMAVFFPVAWLIGDRLVPVVVRWEKELHSPEASLALFVGLILVYSWAAQVLGSVATITGAYLLGVVVARHIGQDHLVHKGLGAVSYAFFVPIFFVSVGLSATAAGLWSAPLVVAALVALAVASKIVGCGVGARLGGLNRRMATQVGFGMISRGEVALVIAGAGLSAGLLDKSLFSILIVVTLATTLITPPLLRWSFTERLTVAPEIADGVASVA